MLKKDHIKGENQLSTYTYTPSDFFAKTKGVQKGEKRSRTHQPTPLESYQDGPEMS